MTTEIEIRPFPTPSRRGRHATRRARIPGLVCRNCGQPEALGPSYVCAACFGPLEVDYDLAVAG